MNKLSDRMFAAHKGIVARRMAAWRMFQQAARFAAGHDYYLVEISRLPNEFPTPSSISWAA